MTYRLAVKNNRPSCLVITSIDLIIVIDLYALALWFELVSHSAQHTAKEK